MYAAFKRLQFVGMAVLVTLPAAAAHAESLRCAGYIVSEGDSRLSLLFKCGPPLLQDSYCAPVFQGQPLQPVPEPLVGGILPCLLTEEWLYDRGPGNLMATVRFRGGVVRTISYGQTPR
jgi:hypothetical protein